MKYLKIILSVMISVCIFLPNTYIKAEQLNQRILKISENNNNDNSIKFNALQSVSDKQVVNVTYEFTVPEWVTLTNEVKFENTSISIYNSDNTKIKSPTHTMSEDIIEQNKNIRKVSLQIDFYSSLPDKLYLQLEFNNLGYYTDSDTENQRFVPLIEGSWNIKCDLDYQQNKKIEVNKSANVYDRAYSKNKEIVIKEVSISPLSISIDYENTADDFIASAWVTLNLNDGTEFICGKDDINKAFFGIDNIGRMTFKNYVDINQVKSITIGNIIVELK